MDMKQQNRRRARRSQARPALLLVLTASLGALMTGCSAKTPAAQSTSGDLHVYAGTSNGQTGSASDQWLLKFDDSNMYYYFYDLSDTQTYGLSNSPTSGNYTTSNGIIDIANPGAGDLYAAELPGEAAVFISPTFPNPVNGVYPPVTAVTAASDKCSSFKGNSTFNFVVLQSSAYPVAGAAPPVYGSVQATSTVDATTGTVNWAFSKLTTSPLGGPASSPVLP